MVRFTKIYRENNHVFLFDKETCKEYILDIDTLISIANHLNKELLDIEGALIKIGDIHDESNKNMFEMFGAFDENHKLKKVE